MGRPLDAAVESVRDQLHAVADAKYRGVFAQNPGGQRGGSLIVDTCRATGEDDAFRLQARDLLPTRIPWQEDAVDARLTHAPRDQLAVLAAKIEHNNCVEAMTGGSVVPGRGDRWKC